MYQQSMPVGSDADKPAARIVDRTLVLEPAEFWPDIMQCPDRPQLGAHQGFDGIRGKVGAEARLRNIGLHLNRGAGEVHAPTAEDRDDVLAQMFRRIGPGLANLRPIGRTHENDGALMKEACLIRGYLRKLEIREKSASEAQERVKQSEARRSLEEYRAMVPGYIEEIASLAEAVARHQQRLDDEKAVARTQMLRQHAETLHSQAVRAAAHTLGLSAPDAPEI